MAEEVRKEQQETAQNQQEQKQDNNAQTQAQTTPPETEQKEEEKPGLFKRMFATVANFMIKHPVISTVAIVGVTGLAGYKLGTKSGAKAERKKFEREASEKQAQVYAQGLNDGSRRNENYNMRDRDKDRHA